MNDTSIDFGPNGATISQSGRSGRLFKITSGSNPYAATEVALSESAGAVATNAGWNPTVANKDLWEINGVTTVAANTIVLGWPNEFGTGFYFDADNDTIYVLDVRNTDGTADDPATTSIRFDKATGLSTAGTAGTSTVSGIAAGANQMGMIADGDQTLRRGTKTAYTGHYNVATAKYDPAGAAISGKHALIYSYESSGDAYITGHCPTLGIEYTYDATTGAVLYTGPASYTTGNVGWSSTQFLADPSGGTETFLAGLCYGYRGGIVTAYGPAYSGNAVTDPATVMYDNGYSEGGGAFVMAMAPPGVGGKAQFAVRNDDFIYNGWRGTVAIGDITFEMAGGIVYGVIKSGTAGIQPLGTAVTSVGFQPLDATLTAFAALTIAANSLTIGTGADAFSQTTFAANTFPARASTGNLVAKTITDAALTVLDDTTTDAMVDTLGGASSTGTGGLVRTGSPTLTTPVFTGLPTGTGVASAATASTLASRDANANLTAVNVIEGYATTATAAGTTTLTVASAYQQYFTGSTTQNCKLPVATTLVNGQSFSIVNLSSGVVTIQTSGLNTLQALAANTSAIVTCKDTTGGTGTASWAVQYLAPSGSGTVTSVSVTTANGVSGSVATATTTPAITLTLGAITPTTVNGITLSGSGSLANSGTSSLTAFTGSGTTSGTNTGDQTNITGNAETVTVANEAADATCFPAFYTSATGSLAAKTNANLRYDSSTGDLKATSFTGVLAGTADVATNVTVANEATDTSCYPLFATAPTGNLPPKSNAGLTYNSNTNSLACTTFVGALTGNASTVTTNANLTGDVTSVGNATTLSASGASAGTYTSVTVDTKGRVTAGTNPNAILSVQQFRLTTETGVAVSTTDRTSQSSLYLTPYTGNQIALYDGTTTWTPRTSAEFKVTGADLTGLTSGKNYDVFAYWTGSAVAAEVLVWTNDTTRATALVRQDGVWSKTGALTRRYVGTFRTTGTTTTEDSGGYTGTTSTGGKRFVWNADNRVLRPNSVIDTTDTWSYTTATIRQARATAGNQVEFVIGLDEHAVEAEVYGTVQVSGQAANAVKVGVGLDSTTAFTGKQTACFNNNAGTCVETMVGKYIGNPGVGYHYLAWLEKGGSSVCTFWGDNAADGTKSGLIAKVWG